MPTITIVPFDIKSISLSVERDAKRSPGIHLSAILRDLKIVAGISKKVASQPIDDKQHLTFQQGFLWERMVAEYLDTTENKNSEWEIYTTRHLGQLTQDAIVKSNGGTIRPGECSLDGIFMTPDAINYRLGAVEEWKSTSIRPQNLDIEKRRPEWLWSTMGYCKAHNLTRGVFRVWHYGQYPPVVQQFIYDWTQEEVDKNWNMVYTHYQSMKREGRA